MSRCEDYPCCGHTPDDPCERQPYDEPGYYDTSIPGNEHALCNHEEGECNVDYYDEDEEDDEPDTLVSSSYCPKCEQTLPLTGRSKVNADRFDPSQIYELSCGHWTL